MSGRHGDGRVSAAEHRAYDYKQVMETLVSALEDAAGATDGSTSKARSDGVSVVV